MRIQFPILPAKQALALHLALLAHQCQNHVSERNFSEDICSLRDLETTLEQALRIQLLNLTDELLIHGLEEW